MTKETDHTANNVIQDVDKVFTISGLAISGLSLLFYPAEEIADASKTDLGFISTITKTFSVLGLFGTLWTVGLLYTKEVDIPPLLKWVFIPLVILDVLLLALLFSMMAMNTTSVSKVGEAALKYVKPAVCSLGAIGMIVAIAVMPKKLLKMSFIGLVIHYLPAGLGYEPINKHPFYALVIFVRTGGLIASLSGGFIEIMTEEPPQDTDPKQ